MLGLLHEGGTVMTELTFSAADWTMDAAGTWLRIKADVPYKAQMFLEHMTPGKKYVAEIREFRKKRSLDANAYFHLLVGKIADVMHMGFEEVKTNLVTEYGTVERDDDGMKVGFKLPVSVDVSRIYRYVKCFDTRTEGGVAFNCYIVFKQTHLMDSKEMSRLIEGTVQEAQNLGIETLTPDELARMNLEWGERAAQTDKGN